MFNTSKNLLSKSHIRKLIERYPCLDVLEKELVQTVSIIKDSQEKHGLLLLCGNGGSAADCDHIAGELLKDFRLMRPLNTARKRALIALEILDQKEKDDLCNSLQKGLRAISLTSHTALNTAIINDSGAKYIFAQQVEVLASEGDVLLAISTSGKAENVYLAAAVAQSKGMQVIGLTGKNGGWLKNICDVTLSVPADSTAAIQELHVPVYHTLCSMLEEEFFKTGTRA